MKLLHMLAGLLASALVSVSVAMAQAELKVFDQSDDASEQVVDHSDWDNLLATYVKELSDGRTAFDYGGVGAADKKVLKNYLTALQNVDPTSLNRDEAFVYWVNLYNAVTIDVILDNYPVKSIRNIRSGFRAGPWQRDLVTVNDVTLTLDNIEHGILRVFWDDNRVHYAVNCASVGCPNLLARAWRAEDLEETLDFAARGFVNHPRGFTIDSRGRAVASSIYNWFKDDFGGNDAGVIAHLQQYAAPETAEKLGTISKIDRYDYDWSINDVE